MHLLFRHLRIPHPTQFLGVLSLCTGVEIISIFMILNKLSGFYGLLAVLTGLRLSALQLSMYIYSCLAIIILSCLMPHIRKKSPFQCILLGYFYLLDTIINTLFIGAFASNWFLSVSNGNRMPESEIGSNTMVETADFTKHNFNSNVVEIKVNSPNKIKSSQDAILCGMTSVTTSSQPIIEETIPSVMLVVALTIIRFYFVFVVFAYARQVIKDAVSHINSSKLHIHTDGCADTLPGKNPFGVDNPEGMGWKGKLGRKMIQMGEGYWLGDDNIDDAWVKGLDGRFRTAKIEAELPGTIERERRARSGTGPSTILFNA